MRQLKQNTAANIMVFMTDSADHVTGKAGLSLTITASKDGGAFASISPTVTERGSGWYNLALTASHTDTLGDLALHITSSGADPSDILCRIMVELASIATVLGKMPTNYVMGSSVQSDKDDEIDGIKAKTDNLPTDPASNTQVNTRLATAGYTAPDNANITAIKAKTDNLPVDPADNSDILAAIAAIPGGGGGASAVDIRIEMDANSTKLAAIKAKTDNIPASPATEASVTERPTLSQIEASTVLAKDATVAKETTLADIKDNTDFITATPPTASQVKDAIFNEVLP